MAEGDTLIYTLWIEELQSRVADHEADPSRGVAAEHVHRKLRERMAIGKAREILGRAGKGNPPMKGDELDG